MIEKNTGVLGSGKNYHANDLVYITHLNALCDVLEGEGVSITYELTEALRSELKKNYKQAFNNGVTSVESKESEGYKEGRLVGYNLGYKEGVDAGKVARKQRLLNSYGGR